MTMLIDNVIGPSEASLINFILAHLDIQASDLRHFFLRISDKLSWVCCLLIGDIDLPWLGCGDTSEFNRGNIDIGVDKCGVSLPVHLLCSLR